MDVMEIAVVEERPNDPDVSWFAIHPDKMFPAMLGHITGVLAADNVEVEALKGVTANSADAIRVLLRRAQALPLVAWEYAGKPKWESVSRGHLAKVEPLRELPPATQAQFLDPNELDALGTLEMRAEALEVCRLWFTELLHEAVEYKPLGVHILRDAKEVSKRKWRL